MNERDYLHEKQIDEAIKRIEILYFPKHAINDFSENGFIYMSTNGFARRMEENMLKAIHDWEERHDAVVYHVICDKTKGELTYSLLFVDEISKSWTEDRRKLKMGRLTVFTHVPNKEGCSTFEEAIIERTDDGLARIK